jgi:hypothetical protein
MTPANPVVNEWHRRPSVATYEEESQIEICKGRPRKQELNRIVNELKLQVDTG